MLAGIPGIYSLGGPESSTNDELDAGPQVGLQMVLGADLKRGRVGGNSFLDYTRTDADQARCGLGLDDV